VALVALALTVGACSETSGSTTTTDAATTAPPPPSTTIPPPTTTEVRALSLVAFGDSFVAWSDWPEMLAADLQASRGLEVALDDSLAAPGSLAPYEPDMLRDDDAAIGLVAGADVLILEPRPFMAPDAMEAVVSGSCGGSSNTDCLDAAIAEMRSYVDEYLDLALALVPDDAEVVAVLIGGWPVDALYPDLRSTDGATHALLVGFVYDLMREVEQSASERGVTVVDIGAIFGGPSYGDVTPDEFLVEDGLHLSEAGSRVVADELLRVLAAT
jgi:hypothetical protein